jgi:hypothetical protein
MEHRTEVVGNNGEYYPSQRHWFRKWSTVQWNRPEGQDFMDTLYLTVLLLFAISLLALLVSRHLSFHSQIYLLLHCRRSHHHSHHSDFFWQIRLRICISSFQLHHFILNYPFGLFNVFLMFSGPILSSDLHWCHDHRVWHLFSNVL